MYLLPLLRGFLVAEGGELAHALPLLRAEVVRFWQFLKSQGPSACTM
jgi:hypothetical protein